jgi:signal transduction histidine kinase
VATEHELERAPPDVLDALGRARRLQLLTEALAHALTPQAVLDAVIETGLGLDAAGASRGLIALVDEEASALRIAAWRGYGEETMRSWATFPLVDDLPLSRAVLSGEPVFISSQEERDRTFPALRGRSEQGHALACLPLVVEGRPLGGLVLSFSEDEEFDQERRAFKVAIARQVAQALERTRLLDAERALRERVAFLAGAGELLWSSLEYEQTLASLAQSAVPRLADWCAVDMLSDDGSRLERLAVVHPQPAMVDLARELVRRYPTRLDVDYGVARALRTQAPEFMPEIPDDLLVAASEGDEELLAILRALGLRSGIVVPLVARGRSLGALTLIRSETEQLYTQDDLALAVELARLASAAVDQALLFRETQRLADAARALEHVAEGVVLVDEAEIVRYWNPGAARITGLAGDAVLGRPAAAIPGWNELSERLGEPGDEPPRPLTLPVPSTAGDRWCSVLGVRFDGGRVYTLRDVTAEHDLERMRSDFVATASHELRTPLAAIYGAIRTIRRKDVALREYQREQFLEMIEAEAERLRAIASQLLAAGSLDADSLSASLSEVELDALVREVVSAAEVGKPDGIAFRYRPARKQVTALADAELLRQVLTSILDNAVKYSPGGGTIKITLSRSDRRARIAVADPGLGIPQEVQPRIFEKFFRVDPSLARGIGGTGLGLYIARALTEKMDGEIRVASAPGKGSRFTVELPLAVRRRARAGATA